MLISEERLKLFTDKIDRRDANECWPWKAAKNKKGYGVFRISQGNILAHRLSYLHSVGEIPDGLFVLHRCDNPPCCNPDHLWVGTALDNSLDMARKGRDGAKTHPERILKGENHGSAKLNDQLVMEIRAIYSGNSITQRQLASRFGVKQYTVWAIVNRRTWKHLV